MNPIKIWLAAVASVTLSLACSSCGGYESARDAAAEPEDTASPSPAETMTTKPTADEATTERTQPMTIYDLKTETLAGEPADLADYRGKVTLVVNVASRCGYTPQYTGLQQLHGELKDRGFAVLGFPCNDFGAQEPGSATEIQEFCTTNFGVDFPMFEKVQTKAGDGQSPIYARLAEASGGELPNWNFCKYLVDREGNVVAFFPSRVAPDDADLRAKIDAAL